MADRSGFTDYVERHSGRLLRSAYLLTQDWARAEDLLQIALAKTWVAWGRVSGDPTPYIYRILTNTHASWWRRRRRGEIPTAQLPEPAGADLTAAFDDREVMWTALARLSARQRAVVVLHYFESFPLTQVHLRPEKVTLPTPLGVRDQNAAVRTRCAAGLVHSISTAARAARGRWQQPGRDPGQRDDCVGAGRLRTVRPLWVPVLWRGRPLFGSG